MNRFKERFREIHGVSLTLPVLDFQNHYFIICILWKIYYHHNTVSTFKSSMDYVYGPQRQHSNEADLYPDPVIHYVSMRVV